MKPVYDAVMEYWNNRAPLFDGVASHVRHGDEWQRVLATAFGQQQPANVLDLGTGTGACALIAASLGHHVTGVDGSTGMLAQARTAAATQGLTVTWQQSPIESFSPGRDFDIVVIRNVLWTLADPLALLKQAATLLRPAGRIVISDGLWSVSPVDRSTYEASLADRLPYHRGLTEEDARDLLKRAGFTDTQSWQHLFTTPAYPCDVPYFVVSASARQAAD